MTPIDGMRRREFLGAFAAATASVVVGFDSRSRLWLLAGQEPTPSFQRIPKLDGALLTDEATRNACSRDDGNIIRRVPAAVLRPRSVRDVAAMLRYANERNIKVALRGQGHSRYGQTLVAGGLVIDTATLDGVGAPTADTIDVQPGASWGKIGDATLARGLAPPVMPDTMRLSAGGTLSVGGFGNTSYRYGAQVDNVVELEVVTAGGDVVTCGPNRDPELFDMVLAGLGQCAVIVRARLRLVPAPTTVVWQEFLYDDVDTWLADHLAAVSERRFDHHGGGVLRQADGSHRFSIVGGSFEYGERRVAAAPQSALRFASAAPPRPMAYREYLHRQSQMIANLYGGDLYLRPSPYLTMWIPEDGVKRMVGAVLATPAPANNFVRFGVWPLKPARHGRPLLPMPKAETAFAFWLFRSAPPTDDTVLPAQLESNRSLLRLMGEVGGKRYAPYGMVMTREEWREHFGDSQWRRLAAAKKRYDPRGLLSPGPGIFA
jgi:cytokinin dehydrogenase